MRDPAEVGNLAPGPANAEATDRQTISVRPVRTETEVEIVVDLIERFHGESIYQQAPFAEDRVRRNARRFRDDTDRRLIALAWSQDRPIGLIAGAVEPLIFADMKQASIAILYVASEGRGSHAAIKLERWFTEQARRVGAQTIGLHVTSGLHHNRTHRLAQHLGYRLIGGNYLK